MTEAQIKYMTDRFLSWMLPKGFNPDDGIKFDFANRNPNYPMPTGTNLLDATQADAMVRHMIEGLPPAVDASTRPVDKIFDPKSERRDANGNIIPWAKEHDYFMAFDPENPDLPMD